MNFYPHHIGDFNNSTRHLTRVERSVYRDAIELQYDTESAITQDFDRLAKRLICVSDEEKSSLKTVLDEFFTLKEDGYVNERCFIEIEKYRANTSAKARAGIASAAKRKQNSTHVEHTLNMCATNQEPITNNQEPITKEKKAALTRPADVDEQVWVDWLALRKAKRAPVTKTTVSGARSQAELAGITLDEFLRVWCRRGSQGLEAAWLKPDERGQKNFKSIGDKPYRMMSELEKMDYTKTQIEGARELLFGGRGPAVNGDFVDVNAKELAHG